MNILVLTALGLLAFYSSGFSAPGNSISGRTIPMPPKSNYDPLSRLQASSDIPDPIENYQFVVAANVDGSTSSQVPLYYISDYKYPAGSIAVGSVFKGDLVRAIAGRNFYGRKSEVKDKNIANKVEWIDGRYLTITKK